MALYQVVRPGKKITHVVLSGENLYTIANRYGVTAKDIRKWNGLGSNRVAKGKRLRLYVDNGVSLLPRLPRLR